MLLLQAFGQRLRAQDQRWVLILDPPIHIRKGYYPYDSGIKNNVFITDISGKPYVGQVSQLLHMAACSASDALSLLYVCSDISSFCYCSSVTSQSDVQLWPGATHWPDFMNPATWTWWMEQIKVRDLLLSEFSYGACL